MILLDTTTVSALMRGDDLAKRRLLAHRRTGVAIPQPVVAEIVYRLPGLPDSRRRARLRERWGVASLELRRAEWTDAVSEAFGRLEAGLERQGTPIDDFDLPIAAHAVALDAILATSNLSYFERIPELVVEDWLR